MRCSGPFVRFEMCNEPFGGAATVQIESNDILIYLDQKFPESRLVPRATSPPGPLAESNWNQTERTFLHVHLHPQPGG